MAKFGYKGFEIELTDFTKHYKKVGLVVQRDDGDEKLNFFNDERLYELIDKHKGCLIKKPVHLRDKKTLELSQGWDYILQLINLDYEETNIDSYTIGCMNTTQTTYIRIKFLIEDSLFILSDSFKSSGINALSFNGYVESLEGRIDEIVDENGVFKEKGIEKGNEEDYRILALDENHCICEFEISKDELMGSLIGVEIYKFEQEIMEKY